MIRSRIAPTPSGYLHIGNAVNFVLTWLWVRREKGVLRLRMDDLDAQRTKPEYIDDIFRTLECLGIDWDEGPQTPDEQTQKYSQLLRQEAYAHFIEQLLPTGQVFACSCSRKTLSLQEVESPCNCRTKNIRINQPGAALRVFTPQPTIITVADIQGDKSEIDLCEQMRDFVIRRRDGIASYQLSSLADDIDFNMNLIIRGADLLSSTAAQLYLAKLGAFSAFDQIKFYHHPLLMDEKGKKLSKSVGSVAIRYWSLDRNSNEKFYHNLSDLLGWPEKAANLHEMLRFAGNGLPLLIKKYNSNLKFLHSFT